MRFSYKPSAPKALWSAAAKLPISRRLPPRVDAQRPQTPKVALTIGTAKRKLRGRTPKRCARDVAKTREHAQDISIRRYAPAAGHASRPGEAAFHGRDTSRRNAVLCCTPAALERDRTACRNA